MFVEFLNSKKPHLNIQNDTFYKATNRYSYSGGQRSSCIYSRIYNHGFFANLHFGYYSFNDVFINESWKEADDCLFIETRDKLFYIRSDFTFQGFGVKAFEVLDSGDQFAINKGITLLEKKLYGHNPLGATPLKNNKEAFWLACSQYDSLYIYKIKGGTFEMWDAYEVDVRATAWSMVSEFNKGGDLLIHNHMLYQFDNEKGLIGESIDIHDVLTRRKSTDLWSYLVRNAVFSPSGKYLYVIQSKKEKADDADSILFYQLAISDFNEDSIINSMELITTLATNDIGGLFEMPMQLGLDDRIYLIDRSNPGYLGLIENPDKKYPQCNYVKNGVYLKGAELASYSTLPNIVHYPRRKLSLGPDTLLCSNDSILLKPNTVWEGDSFHWQDGHRDSAYTATKEGLYILIMEGQRDTLIDSIYIAYRNKLKAPVLPKDTSFCAEVKYEIGESPVPGISYRWNSGDTTSTLNIDGPGLYILEKSHNGFCTKSDSIHIGLLKMPKKQHFAQRALCEDDSLIIQLKAKDGVSYYWSNGQEEPTLSIAETGTYYLISRRKHCEVRDTLVVASKPYDSCAAYLYIPNSFSPNGDGLNDEFEPLINQGKIEKMRIFNRWGTCIWESARLWDGTFRDVPVQEGMYFYQILYEIKEQKILRKKYDAGPLYLVR